MHTGTPNKEPASVLEPDLSAAVDRKYRHEQRLKKRDFVLAIATPVVLLALWELASRAGFIDSRLYTPPSAIAARAWEMITSGTLWIHLGATIGRLTVGFIAGSVAGIAVGLLMGLWRPLRAALEPTFTALYALPKIAILPLLLLIFGLTETPKILAVTISVFFVVQINTLSGIRQIDARLLEAARAYQAKGINRFRYVLLPGALPAIITGLRIAAGMAVIVITAVEFVASNEGLGYLIWNSWQLFQPATMFVGLITVALIGAAATGLIILLERALIPWRRAGVASKKERT